LERKDERQIKEAVTMIREPFTMFCYADISGQLRGKGFPTRLLEKRLKSGVGWTPTNLMFTALGTIAPSQWGPFGDVLKMPDRDAEANVDFGDGLQKEHFFLSNILETDGTPWDCCPRTLLRNVAEDLRRETGITLRIAFEHEFLYSGGNGRTGDMYALDAVRRHGSFGEAYLAALAQCGIEVDSYLAEFGFNQFEVTFPPEEPLVACDKAIMLREMARAAAARFGHTVSFSPRVSTTGIGNGLHIHLSLWDEKGKPLSHDPTGPQGVSETAGRFLAGIVKHMPALVAFTAPTPISYLRLVPHVWSAAWSSIGYRDREAGIRICPTFATSERSTAEQFNFEYRAADATANVYLQLAVLLRAGLEGLRQKLPMPEPVLNQDPGELGEAERQRRFIRRLPKNLGEALAALEADKTVQGFLPPRFLKAFRDNKQAELELTKDWDAEELCRRYVEVY
jgi:glutamine synthetase